LLNPNLDIEMLRYKYREDQRVRIDNLLDPGFAQQVVNCLRQSLPFDYIFHNQGLDYVVSEQEMGMMTAPEREKLLGELSELASQGVGFLYGGYRMTGQNLRASPTVLTQLFDLINSHVLEVVASISETPNLQDADGQFTRLTRGHYLTRHKDDISAERRRLAYVLNFTESWHPDWGGLLQFFNNDGTTRDAWEPRFNSLNLFDVRHIHSVTYLAPHAKAPRFALTGWYHSKSD
jgi:SM-20-related protein